MAGNGKPVDEFVADLFNDSAAPARPHPGMVTQRIGNGAPNVAAVPSGGLQGFNAAAGGLSGITLGNPLANMPMGGLNTAGARPIQMVGQPGVMNVKQVPSVPSTAPPMAFPSNINTTGFAGTATKAPTHVTLPTSTPGAGGINAFPTTISGANAPNLGAKASAASARPQTVSAASATAAMARPATGTPGPAAKKQMTSVDGQGRARNADGSLKKDEEDEEEELIGKEDEVVAYEPIKLGGARMTEEEMKAERAKDEQRRVANLRVIKAKIDSICATERIACGQKVAEAMALGLQRRLEEVVASVIDLSKRRIDVEADSPTNQIHWVRTSNPRVYLKKQEEARAMEREKRLAEREAQEKGQSGASLDPSALRRQEEETTATVLEMGLARRLPAMTASALAAAASSNANPLTSSKSHSAMNDTSSASSAAASIKERQRRVTLHDGLNFLLSDPQLKHSLLTLRVLAGLRGPDPTLFHVNAASTTAPRAVGGATPTAYTSGATPTVSTSRMAVDVPPGQASSASPSSHPSQGQSAHQQLSSASRATPTHIASPAAASNPLARPTPSHPQAQHPPHHQNTAAGLASFAAASAAKGGPSPAPSTPSMLAKAPVASPAPATPKQSPATPLSTSQRLTRSSTAKKSSE